MRYASVVGINSQWNIDLDWVSDEVLWRKKDYWATPGEAFRKGSGDCEDFAIAKYFSLREASMEAKDLRITYVLLGPERQAHMVLLVNWGDWIVLDCERARIDYLPNRKDLKVVYGFNEDHFFLRDKPVEKHPTQVLAQWKDLIERRKDEVLSR